MSANPSDKAPKCDLLVVSDPETFTEVATLAAAIWKEHYTPIIGAEQVAYMLNKFQSEQAMRLQVADGFQYFVLRLRENQQAVGYMAVQPRDEMLFLSKIYVAKDYRGMGFGQQMLSKTEAVANDHHCHTIQLTVNKYNTHTIKAYKKMGFAIVKEAVFDIGQGYVMDDFVLEKELVHRSR